MSWCAHDARCRSFPVGCPRCAAPCSRVFVAGGSPASREPRLPVPWVPPGRASSMRRGRWPRPCCARSAQMPPQAQRIPQTPSPQTSRSPAPRAMRARALPATPTPTCITWRRSLPRATSSTRRATCSRMPRLPPSVPSARSISCLLYTSDAADD